MKNSLSFKANCCFISLYSPLLPLLHAIIIMNGGDVMKSFPDELVDLWYIACPYCHSELLNKNGKYKGRQRFLCLDCNKTFTSYSKSLLNASKINPNLWHDVLRLIINGSPLKSIEDKVGISYVSLSKIRLRMFEIFYNYNQFSRLLLNVKNQKTKACIYVLKLSSSRYVLTIKDQDNKFNSKYFNTLDFEDIKELVQSTPSVLMYESTIDDLEVIKYHDSLQRFLVNCRGIKEKYLNLYITFHALRYQTSITETLDYLKSHISICMRPCT